MQTYINGIKNDLVQYPQAKFKNMTHNKDFKTPANKIQGVDYNWCGMQTLQNFGIEDMTETCRSIESIEGNFERHGYELKPMVIYASLVYEIVDEALALEITQADTGRYAVPHGNALGKSWKDYTDNTAGDTYYEYDLNNFNSLAKGYRLDLANNFADAKKAGDLTVKRNKGKRNLILGAVVAIELENDHDKVGYFDRQGFGLEGFLNLKYNVISRHESYVNEKFTSLTAWLESFRNNGTSAKIITVAGMALTMRIFVDHLADDNDYIIYTRGHVLSVRNKVYTDTSWGGRSAKPVAIKKVVKKA